VLQTRVARLGEKTQIRRLSTAVVDLQLWLQRLVCYFRDDVFRITGFHSAAYKSNNYELHFSPVLVDMTSKKSGNPVANLKEAQGYFKIRAYRLYFTNHNSLLYWCLEAGDKFLSSCIVGLCFVVIFPKRRTSPRRLLYAAQSTLFSVSRCPLDDLHGRDVRRSLPTRRRRVSSEWLNKCPSTSL